MRCACFGGHCILVGFYGIQLDPGSLIDERIAISIVAGQFKYPGSKVLIFSSTLGGYPTSSERRSN